MKYLHDKTSGRTCGACTECCTALAVAELEKPLWKACDHLCNKGCGIYENRPAECQKFECMWLRGFFGSDEHRPDRLGFVVATVKDRRLGKILAIWESRPLAAESEKGRYILERLSTEYYIYFFPYRDPEKRVVMGPDMPALARTVAAAAP